MSPTLGVRASFHATTGLDSMPLFAFLLFAMVVVGCGPDEQAEPPEGGDLQEEALHRAEAADTLTWQEEGVERRSDDCEADEAACATVRLSYPRFDDPAATAAGDWVRRGLTGWDDPDGPEVSSPEGWAEAFIDRYEAYRNEVTMPVAGWFAERQVRVMRNDAQILALELFSSHYTGGAHPLSIRRHFHLDRESGEPLTTLEALLRPGGGDSLATLAAGSIREARGIADGAPLSDAGIWTEPLPLPDTFLLGIDGLLLLWNVYEIAPYAVGPIEVRLPWDAVQGLLVDPSGVVPE